MLYCTIVVIIVALDNQLNCISSTIMQLATVKISRQKIQIFILEAMIGIWLNVVCSYCTSWTFTAQFMNVTITKPCCTTCSYIILQTPKFRSASNVHGVIYS